MKRSSKILITGLAVIGLSAASISWVSAQGGWGGCRGYNQPPGESGMMGNRGYGRGMMGGDRSAMMEQRMDAMKSRLQISEAQEPAWQEFKQAIVSKMSQMGGRGMRGMQAMPVAERTAMMRQRAATMNNMADAMEKFYGELSPEQKQIADSMTPMGRRF